MNTLRIMTGVIVGLISLRGFYLTWQQLRSLQTNTLVVRFKLIGWLILLACTVLSLIHSSWRLLGLGLALYGMIAGLGFEFAMMLLSSSTRRHALFRVFQNLPWWIGILVSLIQGRWLPLLIGVPLSVLLYLVLSPARNKSAPTSTPIEVDKT